MRHDDPFAPLTRKRRLSARRDRILAALRRPFAGARPRPRREGPPNVLLLAVDTLRDDHVGRHADVGPVTPTLDALAREGVRFADVLSPSPWTLPSFASALTGVMPSLHGAGMTGAVRNMAHQVPARLRRDVAGLAGHLADRGYRTGAVTSNPFVGFGLTETFAERIYRNHAADDVAALALDWIRRRADRPFCAFVLFNDTHEPTLPPPRFARPHLEAAGVGDLSDDQLRALARWGDDALGVPHLGRAPLPLDGAARRALAAKRALYAASATSVDAAIARILARLDDWGLTDNTLVVVWSDHGEEFLEHAEAAARWSHDPRGLHGIGHGQSHFQELLHVPWLVRGPGVPAGVVRSGAVSLCDLAPSVAAWTGAPPLPLPEAATPGLTGAVLSLDDEPSDERTRTLLAENIAYGPDLIAVRRGAWKLIARRDPLAALALYDLDGDPGEKTDRREDEPDRLRELLDVAAAWRRECGDVGGGDGGWDDVTARVRRQLRELGYAE